MSLHDLLRSGKVNRKDAKTCEVSERRTEILRSMFGSYVFHAFPTEAMHKHFNENCREKYQPDFYSHMLQFHPQSLHRECALIYLCVTGKMTKRKSEEKLRDDLCAFLRDAYGRISNHCILAIHIQPFSEGEERGEWRLFSDIVLYAEKHREIELKTGYFHPHKIELTTADYIPALDKSACQFELANEGFSFKDCFVLLPEGKQEDKSRSGELLVVLEKNERDETVIPCPACRSFNVAGNSYPALGIRSWECRNPICPARSAFNRGNRYSLSAIIRQEAIRSEDDQIPISSLKRWKLDVVDNVQKEEVAEMLVRHYTLHGDSAVFVNADDHGNEICGRRIAYEKFKSLKSSSGEYASFQGSALFHRFTIKADHPSTRIYHPIYKNNGVMVYNADCSEVLSSLDECSVDGAITSPPYYNARSYSTWPNIYCYLYDMFNGARASLLKTWG